jgi:DNA-binding NarL/FixJ family response regulator
LIRVWIDASSPLARAGFESMLARVGDIDIADSASGADVILTDELPHAPEGFSAIVVLSNEPITALTIQLGVRAMLPRQAPAAQIIAAIHAAAAGLIAIPVQSSPVLIPASTEGEMEALSPRELEAFEMMAEGLSNKQIAAKLGISEHTAKFHVNSILSKLRAGTRTEAVIRGLRRGILKV